MHGSRTQHRLGAVPIVLVVIVVIVACVAALALWLRPYTIVVDGKASDIIDNPECPHLWSLPVFKPMNTTVPPGPTQPGQVDFTVVASTESEAAISGATTNVPEFHDCQRLRTWDATASKEAYGGPLAGVFASKDLATMADTIYDKPTSVALVFRADGIDFSPLNLIKSPYACVVVRKKAGQEAAWIVPVSQEAWCVPALGPVLVVGQTPLALRILDAPAGMAPTDLPPVVRWDWDESTHSQYVSVRCGTKWCEVGVTGFASSASHDPGEPAGAGRRGYAMRGAYDEQRLAEYEPAGSLVAAMNLGTVVPTEDLVAFTAGTGAAGDWTEVARIHMSPTGGSYPQSFGFAATTTVAPDEAGASRLFLCRQVKSGCRATRRWQKLNLQKCNKELDGTQWVARVDPPTGPSKYFCTWFRGHEGDFRIPAVVRWRWRKADETIWVSCPQGCCEVNARPK